MFSRLGKRGYCVKEDSAVYGFERIDCDPDSDFDPEKTKYQQADALNAHSSRQRSLALCVEKKKPVPFRGEDHVP